MVYPYGTLLKRSSPKAEGGKAQAKSDMVVVRYWYVQVADSLSMAGGVTL